MPKKIFKLLLFFVLFSLISHNVWAMPRANIFAYPREVPSTPIYDRFGKSVNLKDFSGNFLIIVFWSKTCIPCLKELDNLSKFVDKTQNNNIKLILVSKSSDWQDEFEQIRLLKKFHASNLDYYLDKDSNLANYFGIFASPHTVLINSSSLEIGRIRGAQPWDNDSVIDYIYKIKAQNS